MLCAICYLIVGVVQNFILGMGACAICVFSVEMFWSGTFSIAAKALPLGGTAMFALMGLAGDVGCFLKLTVVGFVIGLNVAGLSIGLFSAMIFPLMILFGMFLLNRKQV